MANKRESTSGEGAGPRRSPGANRQRDAERARRLLLEAALDEFADKGFAGARTQAIRNDYDVLSGLFVEVVRMNDQKTNAFEIRRLFCGPNCADDFAYEHKSQ